MRYDQIYDLINECKPRTIIEIGMHHGTRAFNMCANALDHHDDVHYIGFDLFADATDETNEREMNGKGSGSLRKAQEAMRVLQKSYPKFKYTLHQGDTRKTLHGDNLVADFVFLDGGHSVETIRGDYEAVKGSKVVVFDDYYVSGADTSKYGCNEVVNNIKFNGNVLPVVLLPKIDTFGELRVQMAVIR